MLKQGDLVIVWDRDIHDMYVAAVAQDTANEMRVNPLVEIKSMIAYPLQRTGGFWDVTLDNAPIPAGTVCRLSFICTALPCFTGEDYAQSLDRALAQMIANVRQRMDGNLANRDTVVAIQENDILARHKLGEFRRDRPLMLE